MRTNARNLVFSALFLTLGILLPIAFHILPGGGMAFSPMHIPVLIAGFVCGWPWGLAVGALTPLVSSLLTQMPAMGSPYFYSMIPELAAYGVLAALAYKLLPKGVPFLYAALILSMLGGRIVWGLAMWAVMGNGYTMNMFLSGAFIGAWPAIVLHIALIPPLIGGLRRAGLISEG